MTDFLKEAKEIKKEIKKLSELRDEIDTLIEEKNVCCEEDIPELDDYPEEEWEDVYMDFEEEELRKIILYRAYRKTLRILIKRLKSLKEELDNLLGGCGKEFYVDEPTPENNIDLKYHTCFIDDLCPSCKSKIPTQEDIAEFYKICEVVL